jgi:imidazolonepropionase-like amidohydrolase
MEARGALKAPRAFRLSGQGGLSQEPAMLARLLIALAALLAAIPAAAQQQTIVIHAGRLIADPSRPAARGPSTITVVDGRIQSVAAGLQPPPAGARLIDLSQRTVLPGLIDMHVHLSGDPGTDYRQEAVDTPEYSALLGVKNAGLTLRAGFTTVRDLGSAPQVGFALARGTSEGLFPGPRIIASGPALSIVGGHGDVSGFRPEVIAALSAHNTCTGAVQCAERVRELARAGARVIKFTATGGVLSQQGAGLEAHFTDEEMRAIVVSAHALGLKVAAHAHGARGIEAAARAGVDSIEHGTFADAAAIQAMRRSGTALVPTLMAFTGARESLEAGRLTPTVAVKAREALSHLGEAVRAARAAGVPVVFGTDAGVFAHGRNGEEFAQLVRFGGMSPAEAIASATTGAARLLGLEGEIGRIAAGYSADLIAVDGDPLADVRALERVEFAMVRGRTAD